MIRLDGTSVGGGTATIAGSIAATQIAYGSGTNAIEGNAGLTFLTATSPGLFLGQKTAAMSGGGPQGSTWLSGIAGSYPTLLMESADQSTVFLQAFTHGGTFSAPTVSSDGDDILVIEADGATTTGGQYRAASQLFTVDGTPTPGNGVGGRISFKLTNGATGSASGFVLDLVATEIRANRDVTVADGKAIQGDTTDAHTYKFNVYDLNTGPAYVTWATVTNGNTPSVVIAPPAGGTTISVQATTYKSSDGSTGGTGTVNTASTPSLVFKNGLFISAS